MKHIQHAWQSDASKIFSLSKALMHIHSQHSHCQKYLTATYKTNYKCTAFMTSWQVAKLLSVEKVSFVCLCSCECSFCVQNLVQRSFCQCLPRQLLSGTLYLICQWCHKVLCHCEIKLKPQTCEEDSGIGTVFFSTDNTDIRVTYFSKHSCACYFMKLTLTCLARIVRRMLFKVGVQVSCCIVDRC